MLKNVSGTTQTDSSITITVELSSGFLIKYNSSGIAHWVTFIDGTGADFGIYVTLDSSNNIYLSGLYTSTSAVTIKNVSGITQVNSSVTLQIASSTSTYLVKYI